MGPPTLALSRDMKNVHTIVRLGAGPREPLVTGSSSSEARGIPRPNANVGTVGPIEDGFLSQHFGSSA